ncbi:divalent-cation tolerance protein CutA [Vibrio sp. WXL103]|uniref:divalent-cation tolerance protein CutA n=1 Tax=unclassified Vibrio TaxID=2614977 RepID=UPI003EC906C4
MDATMFAMVLTTAEPGKEQAIIESLLENKLAACIQTLSINSHYVWQGKICHDDEVLLVIKTQRSLYTRVEQAIQQAHTYDVPQIVMLPFIEGFNPYLAWIEENTK